MRTLKQTVMTLLLGMALADFCTAQSLKDSFVSPPNSAKPHTWWHWMNGYVSADGITADLEAMKRTGIGGFQAFHIERGMSPGPVKYLSPQWRKLMTHTIKEADRLGLEVCFHNCAGWSSSGGPWITAESSMKKVAWTEQQVSGPKSVSIRLEKPTGRSDYSRDIAVLAFPTPGSERAGKEGFRVDNWKAKAGFTRDNHISPDSRKVNHDDLIDPALIADLSQQLKPDGQLVWDVPVGEWTIVRFAYIPTGVRNRPAPREGRGYECDKLSKAAAELHWEHTVQKVLDDAGPLASKVLNNVLVDSYEVMEQNWTEGFEIEFENRMGYNLKHYLPTITGRVVKDLDITERFLWDYRRVIADMLIENYFGHFAEMCHRNGLLLSNEPYGKPGNLDNFAVADIADIPMGEWWARKPTGLHNSSSKMAASAAHTNGRRFVGAEAFTAGRQGAAFNNYPYYLKAQGDYFFCQGINRFIFHSFVHQPWDSNVLPGMTMGPWGIQNNRNNTWYEQGKAWNEYLTRSQYLLQEGKFQADLCYYPGENAPQACPLREDMQPAVPQGYDYDTISRKNLMKLAVQDGSLVLPGLMEYRLLVMPAGPVRLEVLEKVRDLLKSGAHVVWAKPNRTPGLQDYPQADQSVQRIATEIWSSDDGSNADEIKIGLGRIYPPGPLETILASMDVQPDVEFHSVQPVAPTLYRGVGYEWIHRKIDSADVYLISNQQEVKRQVEVRFRSRGRVPQLWNAQIGQIEQAPVYAFTDDGRTLVKLFMEPAEAVFVVFQDPSDAASVVDVLHNGTTPFHDMATKPLPLKIIQATYGDLQGDPGRQADVTKKIRSSVVGDSMEAIVDWKLVACDPARGVIKELRVDYSIGDKKFTTLVKQNETLKLNSKPEALPASPQPADLLVSTDETVLTAWEPGEYELVYSDGKRKTVTVTGIPNALDLSNDWKLHCPDDWGPGTVNLEKLISWTQHSDPDLKHFSGTAVYKKQFDVPADQLGDGPAVRLDLGEVKLFAEVILNGKNLGVLWKPPYQVDVTGLLMPINNQLEVRVTNLWINRLIGDAIYHPEGLYDTTVRPKESLINEIPDWLQIDAPRPKTKARSFVTCNFYSSDSPLVESGLLGPVRLSFGIRENFSK